MPLADHSTPGPLADHDSLPPPHSHGDDHAYIIIIIIINDTLARSLEPVVTECKEHTIHTQTQVVASRKPKEIKRTHEGEAKFNT